MSRATRMTAAKINAGDDLHDEYKLLDIEATRNRYVASMRRRDIERCLAALASTRELLS